MPVKKPQIKEKSVFEKVAVKPEIKREINILSAMKGKPVYKVVEEMLATYKAAQVEALPTPKGGKKVKLVKAVKVSH